MVRSRARNEAATFPPTITARSGQALLLHLRLAVSVTHRDSTVASIILRDFDCQLASNALAANLGELPRDAGQIVADVLSCHDDLMPIVIDIRVCELLAARLCHDMAGPVAAIANGAELLDDSDPDFAREAAVLIGESARTAAKRLQLFRYVFGFSRGAHAGPPPHALASEYFAGSAIECDYPDAVRELEPEWQRLACCLLFVGAEGLPRGGKLMLGTTANGPALIGTGEGDGPLAESRAALTRLAPVAELTSRSVCAYFAELLAEGLGRRLTLSIEPGRFEIKCEAGA